MSAEKATPSGTAQARMLSLLSYRQLGLPSDRLNGYAQGHGSIALNPTLV